MFTNDTYILCAAGSVTTQRLDIMVYATTHERAVEIAKTMVQSLAAGEYFHFDLYFISANTATADKPIATFTTKKPPIEVSVKANF